MNQCPVPAVPQPLTITMYRDLSADEMDGLRRKLTAAPLIIWAGDDDSSQPPAS